MGRYPSEAKVTQGPSQPVHLAGDRSRDEEDHTQAHPGHYEPAWRPVPA